jgi:hypothetical protein
MAVRSSTGDKSDEISTSGCYITVPALIELVSDNVSNTSPYSNEINAVTGTNKTISYMGTNEARKRTFDNGNYNAYWTRSPSAGYSNYVCRIDENGQSQLITSANNSLGVLIEISF